MDQVTEGTSVGKQAASTVDQHVGARLRERRRALHMTAGDLAALLDVKAEELRAMEDGVVRVSAVQLQALCTVLRLTPADLFDGVA